MSEKSRISPERWQRIEQIYCQALERESHARAAMLDDACAGDAALRQEVESLLASEPAAADFIESSALDIAADMLTREPDVDLVGRHVGPYLVEAWLGSGGMGDVYRARDGQPASRRRAQGPPGRLRPRSRPARTLQTRSAGPGLAQSSEHRRDLRLRGVGRRAGARAGAGRGTDARAIGLRRDRSRSTRRCRSRDRSPRRSKRRTSRGSSIAISSPRTSRCGRTAR